MPDKESTPTLGETVQAAYSDAIRQWLKKHSNGRPWEAAAQEDVSSYTVTANLNAGRRSHIYVEILCHQAWKSEAYGYRVELLGHRHTTAKLTRVI